MIDLYLVFDNINDLNKLEEIINDKNFYLHYLDVNNHYDRSKAFKFKGEWSARQNPFILLEEKGKVLKAYYSEIGENAVTQFIKDYTKDYNS